MLLDTIFNDLYDLSRNIDRVFVNYSPAKKLGSQMARGECL